MAVFSNPKSVFFASILMLLTVAGAAVSAPRRAVAQEPVQRTAFVHLFEWRWDDIALECEQFLGPKGFAAVQVSPPSEHRKAPGRPWWERYQPVSYNVCSRGGDRAAFDDMVRRCDAAGVKIYVDAVINHMTGERFDNDALFGTGVCGAGYDYYDYPGVPFSRQDFHDCGRDIQNYNDRSDVQNCNLVALADLNTGKDYVQGKIAGFMNDLVSTGVAGFRIDAAKHMATGDIQGILGRVNGDPVIFQEVIEAQGQPIGGPEYFQNGMVTEFDYGKQLSRVFQSGRLEELRTFGESWGELMPSDRAVVFIDNHDNQRGHGGAGHVITHKDGRLYDLVNVFMLAWPYGYPKIMSSYGFENTDAGPPMDGDQTRRVHPTGGGLNCFGDDWKCEHRWRAIANMVAFRNHTLPAWSVDNWWSNGNNQIAFSRGDMGFLAINKETSTLDRTFQIGLPAGSYCDAWSGEIAADGSCTGTTVTVNGDGTARIRVLPWTAVAIHVGAKVGGTPPPPPPPPPGEAKRTVILIEGETQPGQDMFVRGGIDHGHAAQALGRNCTAANMLCAIPISHRNPRNATTQPWKQGDGFLDWYGPEAGQNGQSNGTVAEGTALDWTTNQWPPDWGQTRTVAVDGYGVEPLNTFGPHYWMLDVDMDCSKTVDGWFEFKSYISNGPGWEGDIQQANAPYASGNHFAKCGSLNVYRRDAAAPVTIRPLE